MKFLLLSFSLCIICMLCGCASVDSQKTTSKENKVYYSEKPQGKKQQLSRKIQDKKQSRSGVFCGDRDVSDDF